MPPTLLPPALSLYLRKLVRQNLDRLAPLDTKSQSELDPTQLFDRLCQPDGLSDTTITTLTTAVDRHQTLLQQGIKGRQALHQVEADIFTSLGLRLTHSHDDGTILIVDDTPGNLRLLSAALVQQGYEVRNAINGSLALSGAKTIRPDLILLDIMMPGMDGYEVCRRLKEDPQTRDIPIIFMSAIDGSVDKVKAFSVGGVDYVSKPFQIEEVLVRIEHQLRISHLQSRLEEQNHRLQADSQNRQNLERYYQQLWEGSSDSMYRITTDGTITSANQALADLLGYDHPTHLIGQNIANFYTRPDRWHAFVAQIQQQSQVLNFESEIRQQNRETLWTTTSAQSTTSETGQITYEGRIQELQEKSARAQRENNRRRLRRLIISLFPKAIAKQFIHDPQNRCAQHFTHSTLMLIAIDDTTHFITENSPADILDRFHQLFHQIETTATHHGIEHIRSIGNTILVAAGIPTPQSDHADRMVQFALDLQQQTRAFPLRMGIHSGPIVGGIIGAEQRLTYELYGETLTFTQHLTQQSIQEKILLSAATHQTLTQPYNLTPNTPDTQETYWLEP